MRVYINLAVEDLTRSRAFFSALGFSFNETFCDDTALGMEINEHCAAMLLTKAKFAPFTPRPLADAGKTTEVLTALANGGSAVRAPEDHGFMYGHAFADPDGHIWEPFWMDLEAMEKTKENAA